MTSQALVKGYGRKSISPRCLIKVNIKKAFDSLQWSFIRDMLLSMNFPSRFVSWIMNCISVSWFSIKLNGKINGFFMVSRGVRQGDPAPCIS